jgi:hypothetical protein
MSESVKRYMNAPISFGKKVKSICMSNIYKSEYEGLDIGVK